jgi:hypothetical protein
LQILRERVSDGLRAAVGHGRVAVAVDVVLGGAGHVDGLPGSTLGTSRPLQRVFSSRDVGRACVRRQVELDHSSDDPLDPAEYERAFMIWPAQKLNHGARYIVAVFGLTDTSGNAIPPSDAFKALRDGLPSNDWGA